MKGVEDRPEDKPLELRDKLDVVMGGNSLNEAIRFEKVEAQKNQKEGEEKEVPQKAEEQTAPQTPPNKMDQFRDMMTQIMLEALRQNNDDLSRRINYTVSESVVREMDYLLRKRDEKQDEHFRKLDKTLTAFRQADGEVAATTTRKEWLWRRKGE